MKGFIPVEIPTKKYIKAYIIAQLGEHPVINTDTNIGSKVYDLLYHKINERRTEFANVRYNAKIKFYIQYRTFRIRGHCLNETNIKNFNLFVEEEIKSRFRFMMDFYISIFPQFDAHLPAIRRELGIDIEAWSDDSMRKDYYRYRKRTKKSMLYKVTAA